MFPNRKSSGSVLLLVALLAVVLIALVLLGLTWNNFLFRRTLSQDKVDALALTLCGLINSGDRVAQMNELEARSRELVFLSRCRFDECGQKDLPYLEPLCRGFIEEARSGQEMLEQERRDQIKIICKDLRNSVLKNNLEAGGEGSSFLGCLRTQEPLIVRLEVGRLAGVESSAGGNELIADLMDFDLSQKYLQPRSRLFKAEVNARLPDPDGDLDYKFSGLAAAVKNVCAPARNVNADVFLPSLTIFDYGKGTARLPEFTPSSVRVLCTMHTAFGRKNEYQALVPVASVGTTNGAVISSSRLQE